MAVSVKQAVTLCCCFFDKHTNCFPLCQSILFVSPLSSSIPHNVFSVCVYCAIRFFDKHPNHVSLSQLIVLFISPLPLLPHLTMFSHFYCISTNRCHPQIVTMAIIRVAHEWYASKPSSHLNVENHG